MSEEKIPGWHTSADAKEIQDETKTFAYKQIKDMKWEPHPINDKLKLAFLLTNKEDGIKVTTLLAKIPKGEELPEHTHEVHDIIFPLSGQAKIWIKGIGEYELKKGVIVHVPPGIPHKVYKVTEDVEIYDVFSGPIL
jgi:quercetin dioxygenase-like cupin family protein